jgi:plasmid replication initiation protein
MKNKDLEVFQSNSFITSRQSYTVQEKRLLSTIISFVKPTDNKFIEYEISIKEWADLVGKRKENFYQIADSVTDGLMSKIIKIDRAGKDGNKAFKKFHVMSTGDYEAGVLKLEISKDMNDIFLQLTASKKYTHYELAEFVTLTSTHAQRIYELVKQYQHHKDRKRTIEITELKEMLGIRDKYKLYKLFRRDVLNVALKQIEEKTKLRYKWRGIRKGRSYHKIEFYEIHIHGKESITEIQEHAIILGYIGDDVHIKEFNLCIEIIEIEKNKDSSYSIKAPDDTWYKFKTIKALKKGINDAMLMYAKVKLEY